MADASRAREGRANKREALNALKSSSVTIEDVLGVLSSPLDDALANVDIWEVLLCVPKLNRKGAKRIFLETSIFPHRTLAELTDREREALISALPVRCRKPTE